MFVSMKTLLEKANKENYAVLAVNCINVDMAKAVIDAASKLKAPIIVNLLQEHLENHLAAKYIFEGIKKLAEDSSTAVAISLDHGQNKVFVKKCIQLGFSGVMMDASMYSLQENIETTNEILKFAESFGTGVEAEVGCMGAVSGDHYTDQQMFTKPEEAIEFINKTQVDCLAISYGSSHGDYPEGYIPQFKLDIVKTIKEATGVALVLHGGSGAGEQVIKESVKLGINKINVGSDFMKAQRNYIKNVLQDNPNADYPKVLTESLEEGKKVIMSYIELTNSVNKI